MALSTKDLTAKPTPPDAAAEVDDWHEFKELYLGWLETAADDEIVAEMVAIEADGPGKEGRPSSPSEAWRLFQCEQRRRRPQPRTPRTGTKPPKG